VLSEGLVLKPRRCRLSAVRELDLDPLVAQDAGAAAARLLGRIVGGDHHSADPGGEDRLGARRLAAVVGAGLEGDVHRRAGGVVAALAAVGERRHLGVDAAELGVKPFPEDLALAADHGADERVRAHPAAPAIGQLQRAAQKGAVGICDHGRHPD
jgi:hypothetical protein